MYIYIYTRESARGGEEKTSKTIFELYKCSQREEKQPDADDKVDNDKKNEMRRARKSNRVAVTLLSCIRKVVHAFERLG